MVRVIGLTKYVRQLSWETGFKQVGFEVFPEGCDRQAISYLEEERVPKSRDIVKKGIRQVFN